MRHILLATTAFIGIVMAGAAQAATSPVTVNIGGSADFLAGAYAESNRGQTAGQNSADHDFETLYDLNFSILGKSGSGVEYGGMLGLGNGPDISNRFTGNSDNPYFNSGYVWMSGAFGKAQLGDSHGATDLVVGTPTIGEGQVTGRYIDFLDTNVFAKNFVTGVDGYDHSTNITYFTPKVGNDSNKVQLGVSYAPQFYNYGGSVVNYNTSTPATATSNTFSPYHDVVKGAVNYSGSFAPVAISASAHAITGSSNATTTTGALGSNAGWVSDAPTGNVQNFTSWGLGLQGAYNGFTLGGGYTDFGHYDAVTGQNKAQDEFTAGLKYEFNKLGVGVSYLGGKGYSNMLTTGAAGSVANNAANYIKDFTSYGAGGSYTWAPGLTSNLDGVYFDQKSDVGIENQGYVLLVSQKLAF